jgi:hypothetical protein
MPVAKSALSQPKLLAQGGFGKVFRVEGNPVPGDKTPLAYKEFTTAFDAQRRSAAAAVTFRQRLKPADRDDLDQCTVWPRELVTDSTGQVSGLLMRLIPDDFFCEKLDPETGKKARKVRDLQWLAAGQAQRDAAEIDLPDIDRLERFILLGKLVYAVGRLHKHGWVFGDLSFKNAAFALNPPRVMLLDCDGAAALTDDERDQPSTLNWDPPECPIELVPGQSRQQEHQDTVTDVYKLGLAVLRCLSPGKGAMSSRSPSRLDGEIDDAGMDLVTRALGDRSSRPTAKELYAYFYRTVSQIVRPPEVRCARLATPVCLTGMDARIEWEIANADAVTVLSADADPQTVDLATHPAGYVIKAPRPGPVRLLVTNRFGQRPVELGDLVGYELPPFTPPALPRPVIPPLAEFQIGSLRPLLDTMPGIQAPQVPPIPSLPTEELVGGWHENFARTLPLPLPKLSEAVIAAAQTIVVRAMNDALEYAATQRPKQLAEPPAAGDDEQ